MRQAIDFSRCIEAGFQILEAAGTIVIVRHIVFARPQQLHGNAGLLRNVGGFHHVIVGETAAETAAAADHVNGHVFVGDSQRLSHQAAAAAGSLAVGPDLELAVFEMRGAILRLKRRVRDEGIRVRGLDDFGCAFESAFGVAVFADFPLRRLLAQLVGFCA